MLSEDQILYPLPSHRLFCLEKKEIDKNNSKFKILQDIHVLCVLVVGKINKHEFRQVLQNAANVSVK
jgi:hypothetical protein